MNKLYGLLGHPVGHSMSPLMHNDAFKQLGINGYYHAFDVPEDKLKEAVDALRLFNISGLNVTIPHKVTIMEFLDEIDEEALMIGAVNTVVNIEGRLIGYNTDGRGYLTSLLTKLNKPLKDSNVLVIGAGGAARGIVTALANDGVALLTIANRTIEKADEIKNHYLKYREANINVLPLKKAQLNLARYDIVINTTSIGMSPRVDEVPISIDHIKQTAVLSDLIYNPIETKLLQLGNKKGIITHNGVGMFVEQGALAFLKWTGKQPDTEKMTKIVMQQLGGSTC
ncbi:shikimate dehydrogenase [Anaerobacillus isosaccharinicus]|uniref:Shikimate dehydrogenase (NADP(+)) n=1 Tax=Anaerobacillus isosaccharinicus TaxID=1532552 RepID=A0A1S2LR82_9BACI|nr:shikimate dehydrogenase [Anaerobacillus isosaccharinicus]MBA5585463.1 shikimate dehydrogenase [Anaerobacillus isosaccharinicus]QOY36220.1 shikimate dehydrogenase [Anaerobacillus isosaccharinicus]